MSLELLCKTKDFSATPQEVELKSLFQSLVSADWIQAFIAAGYGWQLEVGNSFDTGITGGGAGTVMDLDQPEFGISVPAGTVVVPFDITINARPGLQTTDSHVTDCLVAVDRTAAWAADGTVTSETCLNLRTNKTSGCPVTCFSAATADITDPVLSQVLARETLLTDVQGTAATVNLMQLKLEYAPQRPPFIVGPAAIYGYFGGSIAVVGFARANFLAFDASLVSSLTR